MIGTAGNIRSTPTGAVESVCDAIIDNVVKFGPGGADTTERLLVEAYEHAGNLGQTALMEKIQRAVEKVREARDGT